jgi:ribosomal protein S18 acetylase RimI-like enzyme
MNADIKISKASYSDLDSVLARQNKIIHGSHASDRNELSEAKQSSDPVRVDYENYLILKAECKDELVGCVKVRETGEFCWIEKLIVSPQFQKMGIGTSLMNEVEKAFPNTRLYLLCTGYRNPENLEFYESLGYKKRELSRDGNNKFLLVKVIKQNLKS